MAERFVVVVEHNLVSAIEAVGEDALEPVCRTPLEAATQLATNNRVDGCIDGRYGFDDAKNARTFAELCLEFTKALAERRLAEVARLPVGAPAYQAGEDP